MKNDRYDTSLTSGQLAQRVHNDIENSDPNAKDIAQLVATLIDRVKELKDQRDQALGKLHDFCNGGRDELLTQLQKRNKELEDEITLLRRERTKNQDVCESVITELVNETVGVPVLYTRRNHTRKR